MRLYLRVFAAAFAVGLLAAAVFGFDTRPEPVAVDGTRAACDLPKTQHMLNVGGSDGAGLCVYTSVTVAARWQNTQEVFGLRKFAEGRPGGSYPEKLEADLKLYASRNAITLPPYIQHTGGDETFLDLCIATRRMPGITYAGLDGFYDSGIAHMVDLSALDRTHGAIIDNNRPGSWVWGTRSQIVNRWKGLDDNGQPITVPWRQNGRLVYSPVGGGWAFVWLTPPPPPRSPTAQELHTDASPKIGPVYCWEREILNDTPFWFLYKDGVLVYVVDAEGKWHKAINEENWEVAIVDPPDGIPAPKDAEPCKDWNHGIDPTKVPSAHRYWLSGVECSRAKCFAAMLDPGIGGLVDDSDKYHLSIVVADVAARTATYAWFAADGPLATYARRLHVQVYLPSDWPASDRLNAAVTLQEPAKVGGKVVGSGATVNVDSVKHVLADVFDPPVAPVPPKPTPPAPVVPAPSPVPLPPSPLPNVPNWAKVLLALLALFLLSKKGK